MEGEPVTQNVRKSSLNKKKTGLKVNKQPTSKRKITRPKRFMDAGEDEGEEEEEEGGESR